MARSETSTSIQLGFDPIQATQQSPLPLDKRAFRQLLQTLNSALRDSDAGGILERFDIISKVLFLKVVDEREVRNGHKRAPDFLISPNDTPQTLTQRLSALWERTCREVPALRPGNGTPSLTEDGPALYRIVGLLESVQLSHTPGDVKGLAYEELLRNTFDKSENQQYFTPHEVVEFMVDIADIDTARSVCDPASGTGGFLVEVFRRGWNGSTLVGADVDERLARVAQLNLLMHGCDRAQVHRLPGAGSLAPLGSIRDALPPSSFDLVLTNPPFGSDLLDPEALARFETGRGRASRRRSVLFTERCIELVRPGGRVVIVLDDSVLNLPSNADIRGLIRSRAIVEAVISLPDVSFMPYSSAKCSVVVLRRSSGVDDTQGPIFMAEAREVGRRPNGDPLYSDERDAHGDRVLLNDLHEIAKAYQDWARAGSMTHPMCFTTSLPHTADRLDIFHYHPARFEAERELAESRWPTPPLRELVVVRRERIHPARELGDAPVNWVGLAEIEEATGEFECKTVRADRIRSQAHRFKGGDILFSRLRPNLQKVVLVPKPHEGGLCSAEIVVLRALDPVTDAQSGRSAPEPEVDFEYLAFMLRSDLAYGQLINHITGLGRPRVSQDAILGLRLPLPPWQEQQRIVTVLKQAQARAQIARERARKWKAHSKRLIEEAYDEVLSDLSANAAARRFGCQAG